MIFLSDTLQVSSVCSRVWHLFGIRIHRLFLERLGPNHCGLNPDLVASFLPTINPFSSWFSRILWKAIGFLKRKKTCSKWWFRNVSNILKYSLFSPEYLGRWSNLTSICFQMGWNKPPTLVEFNSIFSSFQPYQPNWLIDISASVTYNACAGLLVCKVP